MVVTDIQPQLEILCSGPLVSDFVLIPWVTWHQFQNPLISIEAIEMNHMRLLNQRGIGSKAGRAIFGIELDNFRVKLERRDLICFAFWVNLIADSSSMVG